MEVRTLLLARSVIQRRDDLTIENVKKLILGAIAEYRKDRKRTQRADNDDGPK